jgi:hypothetical protein
MVIFKWLTLLTAGNWAQGRIFLNFEVLKNFSKNAERD